MHKTFTLRLRPNKTQITMFEYILDYNCETYNAALQERKEAWTLEKKSIDYYHQCHELVLLQKCDSRFQIISTEIQRDPLYRLHKHYADFYRRCRRGEKPGFPRFRSRKRYNTFSFGGYIRIKNNKILIPKLGYIKFKNSQQIIGTPKLVIVKQIGDNWVIRLCCDLGVIPPRKQIDSDVGIDLGINKFLTLSNGSAIDNPRFLRNCEKQLAKSQQELARKKWRSKNRIKAKEHMRRAYQRLRNTRQNFLHHISKQLVSTYDLIVYEDLKIANMVRSHFGKSIMDAAWGILIKQLIYKAEYAGKWLVPVNPKNTTRTCSQCGKIVKKEIWERTHNCECGLTLDRDHNAAINILRLGRSLVGLLAE